MHRVGEKAENQRKTREKTKCFAWISAPKKKTAYTLRAPLCSFFYDPLNNGISLNLSAQPLYVCGVMCVCSVCAERGPVAAAGSGRGMP